MERRILVLGGGCLGAAISALLGSAAVVIPAHMVAVIEPWSNFLDNFDYDTFVFSLTWWFMVGLAFARWPGILSFTAQGGHWHTEKDRVSHVHLPDSVRINENHRPPDFVCTHSRDV
jgi:hypothetical protein